VVSESNDVTDDVNQLHVLILIKLCNNTSFFTNDWFQPIIKDAS
jgi:hypothetical protein